MDVLAAADGDQDKDVVFLYTKSSTGPHIQTNVSLSDMDMISRSILAMPETLAAGNQ
jgi:hypothetical protein